MGDERQIPLLLHVVKDICSGVGALTNTISLNSSGLLVCRGAEHLATAKKGANTKGTHLGGTIYRYDLTGNKFLHGGSRSYYFPRIREGCAFFGFAAFL